MQLGAAPTTHACSVRASLRQSRRRAQQLCTARAAATQGSTSSSLQLDPADIQPVQCLKEWAVTCAALGAGQQTVSAVGPRHATAALWAVCRMRNMSSGQNSRTTQRQRLDEAECFALEGPPCCPGTHKLGAAVCIPPSGITCTPAQRHTPSRCVPVLLLLLFLSWVSPHHRYCCARVASVSPPSRPRRSASCSSPQPSTRMHSS